MATVARCVSEGFDSPGVRVRLPGAPGGKSTSHEWEQSDGVGSPERSPSSRNVVIACVVSSQKRGVDMTRGYYVSAAMCGATKSARLNVLCEDRAATFLFRSRITGRCVLAEGTHPCRRRTGCLMAL